jgi:hypothetical protein
MYVTQSIDYKLVISKLITYKYVVPLGQRVTSVRFVHHRNTHSLSSISLLRSKIKKLNKRSIALLLYRLKNTNRVLSTYRKDAIRVSANF